MMLIDILLFLYRQFSVMENRPQLRNRDFRSPDIATLKRIGHAHQAISPKFTRKRIEPPNVFTRKTQKNLEQPQAMTYISPKKYLDQQITATESVRSIASFASFSRCDKSKQSSTCYNNTERDSISSTSIPELKMPQNKTFQTAEEIRMKVRANQEMNDLKIKNQALNKRIFQLNQRLKGIKEENQQLYKKIQSFNEVLAQKNQIINQFSHALREKQKTITIYQVELQYAHKRCEQQDSVISLLNKTIQQMSVKAQVVSIDDTDDGEKQSLAQQIEKYKEHIAQLVGKLKYSQIQAGMYQKLRYDLSTQVEKNQTLKMQNKKLIARLEHLVNQGKQDRFSKGRNRKQSDFFQLSPDK